MSSVPLSKEVQVGYINEKKNQLLLTGKVANIKLVCTPDLDHVFGTH